LGSGPIAGEHPSAPKAATFAAVPYDPSASGTVYSSVQVRLPNSTVLATLKRCLVMKSDFDGDYLASDLKRWRDRRYYTAISGPPDRSRSSSFPLASFSKRAS
jgi:hypothetical protein